MSAITQTYQQTTVSLEVSGIPAKSAASGDGGSPLAQIQRDLVCHITVQGGSKPVTLRGDQDLLKDLVAVMRRYLAYSLSAQPQGTFSGTVAIRPLDFIFHRLTVRQGEGIAQVDLSMTQLYDLAEGLEDIAADLPQLQELKSKPKGSGRAAWGAGIAALVVGGIGVATAIAVLGGIEGRRQDEDFLTPSTAMVERSSEQAARSNTSASNPNGAVDQAAGDNASESEDAPLVAEIDPEDPEPVDTSEIAALPPAPTTSIVELSEAGLTLLETLNQDWEAPDGFTIPLSYVVTVNSQGSPIAVTPVDELSAEGLGDTPLAAWEGAELETVPEEVEVFSVTFVQDQVSVSPQP